MLIKAQSNEILRGGLSCSDQFLLQRNQSIVRNGDDWPVGHFDVTVSAEASVTVSLKVQFPLQTLFKRVVRTVYCPVIKIQKIETE